MKATKSTDRNSTVKKSGLSFNDCKQLAVEVRKLSYSGGRGEKRPYRSIAHRIGVKEAEVEKEFTKYHENVRAARALRIYEALIKLV
jgi:hypothetical protein